MQQRCDVDDILTYNWSKLMMDSNPPKHLGPTNLSGQLYVRKGPTGKNKPDKFSNSAALYRVNLIKQIQRKHHMGTVSSCRKRELIFCTYS